MYAERRTTRQIWEESVNKLTQEWEKLPPEEQKRQCASRDTFAANDPSLKRKSKAPYHPTRLSGRL